MQDYEYAGLQRQIAFRAARRVLAPDAIPVEAMRRAGASARKLFRYPGLKEDYYLSDFEPDPAVLDELGIDRDRVLVVVRPPPETSAYHAATRSMRPSWIGSPATRARSPWSSRAPRPGAVVLERGSSRSRARPTFLVPPTPIDAQSLIAFADLVVSAGGTMNREAVALGTPAYTIFSGRMGAVDERLIAAGRLRPLDDPSSSGAAQARRRSRACGSRATRSSWSTESSRPSGSLARGRSTNASARPSNLRMRSFSSETGVSGRRRRPQVIP